MSANTGRDQRKKRATLILSWVVTIVAIVAYIPFASETIKACKKLNDGSLRLDPFFHACVLMPPLCALGAALTLIYIGYAKTADGLAQACWGLLLLGAFLGWPVSLFVTTLLTTNAPWVAH